MPAQVTCANCPRKFGWAKGKVACSTKCRSELYFRRRSAVDRELTLLPVIRAPPDFATRFAGQSDMPDAELAYVIQGQASEHAIGFRLGCLRESERSNKHPCMRWFPLQFFGCLPLYSIRHWQTVHTPFAGLFVVAYFDKNFELVSGPQFQVEVSDSSATFSWSQGDPNMLIDPKKFL